MYDLHLLFLILQNGNTTPPTLTPHACCTNQRLALHSLFEVMKDPSAHILDCTVFH